jgi:hypothetical protein
METIEAMMTGEVLWCLDTSYRFEVTSARVDVTINGTTAIGRLEYSAYYSRNRGPSVYGPNNILEQCISYDTALQQFNDIIKAKNKEITDENDRIKRKNYAQYTREFIPIFASLAQKGFYSNIEETLNSFMTGSRSKMFPAAKVCNGRHTYTIEFDSYRRKFCVRSNDMYTSKYTKFTKKIEDLVTTMHGNTSELDDNKRKSRWKAKNTCARICCDIGAKYIEDNVNVSYGSYGKYNGFYYHVKDNASLANDFVIGDNGVSCSIGLNLQTRNYDGFVNICKAISGVKKGLEG